MEPVFAVAQEPPAVPPQQRLGQVRVHGGGWRRPVRCALALVLLFLAVTGNFAFAAYRARHSSGDLAFVLVAYFLLALLVCCVARLEHLRRDPAAAAARVAERRWFRIAVWVVSVALANTFASRVADALPRLALKLVVWGVTAVVLGLVFYFVFFSKDAEHCCDEDLGRGQADAGRRQVTALHELPPEEKV